MSRERKRAVAASSICATTHHPLETESTMQPTVGGSRKHRGQKNNNETN